MCQKAQGAIAGRKVVEKYGWEIGDRIPLQGTVWRKKDGSSTWEYVLEGIYSGAEKGVDETIFFTRFDYFDESHSFGSGMVGWYVIVVDDPVNADEVQKVKPLSLSLLNDATRARKKESDEFASR